MTTKFGSYIPLVMLLTRLDFGGILLETFLAKFSFKISDVFFPGQTLNWTYLRNGWSNDVKQKVGALVRYWVNYVTLTFDLTHYLDVWFFKVKFQNNYLRNCYLIDVKQKESKSIRYSADCMVLPFDHTHDLDLVVSRSKFEIAFYEEW